MQLTAEYIERSGRLRPVVDEQQWIEPHLELVCDENGVYPHSDTLAFKKGDVVHASKFQGKTSSGYPNTVHLYEKGFWWPLDMFSVKES